MLPRAGEDEADEVGPGVDGLANPHWGNVMLRQLPNRAAAVAAR